MNKCTKQEKSDNFCYRKVERAITIWGAIEKNSMLILQYGKINHFDDALNDLYF